MAMLQTSGNGMILQLILPQINAINLKILEEMVIKWLRSMAINALTTDIIYQIYDKVAFRPFDIHWYQIHRGSS